MSVNSFDVLKAMSTQNKDIRMFPLNANLKAARVGKNGWGSVTLAVNNETAQQIIAGNQLFGFLLAVNAEQYNALTAEMEAQVPKEAQ